tara:strand:- start:1220 stop:1897 length:678 start_codon:yes stop_codon:yes gene_type:complete
MAIGTALMVGSAIFGGMSRRRQAKRQAAYNRRLQIQRNKYYMDMVAYQQKLADFQEERYNYVAGAAKTDADQQYQAILEANQQRKKNAFQTINQYARRSQAASGAFRTMNTETTGQSKQLALQEFENVEARAANIIHDNFEGTLRQSQRQVNAVQAQAQNRINAAMPSPMQPLAPPDQLPGTYVPGGMDIAIAAAGAFGSSYMSTAAGLPQTTDVTWSNVIARLA